MPTIGSGQWIINWYTSGIQSVYVNVALALSSKLKWYNNFIIYALNPGAFKVSTSLGIIP